MTESRFNPDICERKEILYKKLDKGKEDNIEVKFHIENKWEGIVLEVNKDKVHSRMTDALTGEDYEFDFSIKDVNKDDRKLVSQGAIFNFFIGYNMVGRTKSNARLIKFRRRKTTQNVVDSILDKMNEWNLKELIEIQ